MAMLAVAIGAPLAAGLLAGDAPRQGTPGPQRAAAGISAAGLAGETPLIARRVEALRRLRFDEPPPPKVVSTAALNRIFRSDYRRPRVRKATRQEGTVLAMLGLIEPGFDLQGTLESSADIVAGAYDPKSKRLFIVRGATLGSRAIAEITLAHELTHALEDQRFGLPDLDRLAGDRALAEQAFVEGTATSLMVDYGSRFVDVGDLIAATTDPALTDGGGFGKFPRVLQEQLLFAYLKGKKLIDALRSAGGGDWDLVDAAYRGRLPISTEQVLHPAAYLRDEKPTPVRIPPSASPGPGWHLAGAGDIGELETSEILELGNGRASARRAAAGWSGDSTRLWARDRAPAACGNDCRRDHALLVSWRWDTRADARQFDRAARRYVSGGLGGKQDGPGLWVLRGGAVSIEARGRETALAFAPTPRLARDLASSGAPARAQR